MCRVFLLLLVLCTNTFDISKAQTGFLFEFGAGTTDTFITSEDQQDTVQLPGGMSLYGVTYTFTRVSLNLINININIIKGLMYKIGAIKW